jgi:ATP-dependent DNA ligase
MLKAFDFCIPTRATAVPAGGDWLHEVKYDGYRLRLERDGDRVRLITCGGHNWADRYPWIVEAALKNRLTCPIGVHPTQTIISVIYPRFASHARAQLHA